MPWIETAFEWIARHETVLSGIAAAIVIVGVIITPIVRAARRLARAGREPVKEGGGASAPALSSASDAPDDGRPSIAVLPFVDRSPGATLDGLCEGLLEDLIAALSRVKPFFVIARGSMLTYRDRDADPRAVASELGVRYVLAGSVVTSGETLRVSAELVDARSGVQVDTLRCERPQTELFSLQDDITQHIVGALAPALKGAEAERARRSETDSLDAWAIVNRAHIRLNQDLGNPEAIRAAVADAREALRLDAEYGLAWAVLGLALSLSSSQRVEVEGGDEPVAEALEAVRRAAQLDPSDAVIHHCTGATMGNLGRTEDGVRAYTRALELDPNAAASHGGLGAALVFAKRAEDAREALERAIRLSPRDARLYHWLAYRGLAELVMGRFEQARDDARASLDRVEGRVPLAVLAVAQANLGNTAEARAAYDRLLALDAEMHPDRWARIVEPAVREDYERAHLVEGMWLASGLARPAS